MVAQKLVYTNYLNIYFSLFYRNYGISHVPLNFAKIVLRGPYGTGLNYTKAWL